MKEGLVHLPKGIVILREERNEKDKIICLVPWPILEIPDSEADTINTSIRRILDRPDYPDTCGLHSIDHNSGTKRISYRIARSGSWATKKVG
jgi:hypothetical protein